MNKEEKSSKCISLICFNLLMELLHTLGLIYIGSLFDLVYSEWVITNAHLNKLSMETVSNREAVTNEIKNSYYAKK